MHPLHKAARDYAQRGIPVFPCEPDSKQPRAGGHGFHDATTDLATIDAWWAEKPYNPAFCPHMVGLGVVDIDGDEGEATWSDRQIEYGEAPATWTVRTPRGGRHLYYKGELPATQGTPTAGLGPHVDTRGVGSYALLPPSVVGGSPYTVEDDSPYADVPDWLAPLIASRRQKAKAAIDTLDLPGNVARARKLLTDYVARGNVAIEGQMGDNKTFTVCCEVLNLGLSPEVALDLITEVWNPHCLPPWDEDELGVKMENASRYAQNEAGAWASAPASEVFGAVLDTLDLTPDEEPEPEFKRFFPRTLREIAALPPPTWLVEDMIPAKRFTMFYGPGGSYKSFLVLDQALKLAAQGVPVVYVAGEGGRELELRAQAWRLLHGIEDELPIWIIDDMPWASELTQVGELIDAIRARDIAPEMVVIDTVARAMVGMNENDARDMGLFVRSMDMLKKALGCAVVAVHHTGKDEGRGARGSVALAYATDAALEVKADKDSRAVAIHVRRMKDAAEREEPWMFEGKVIGPSLAFAEIDRATYRLLTHVEDQLAPRKIGQALAALDAYGPEQGVTTSTLAAQLHEGQEADSAEAHVAAIARISRALSTRASGQLEAYAYGDGRNRRWYLPKSDDEA